LKTKQEFLIMNDEEDRRIGESFPEMRIGNPNLILSHSMPDDDASALPNRNDAMKINHGAHEEKIADPPKIKQAAAADDENPTCMEAMAERLSDMTPTINDLACNLEDCMVLTLLRSLKRPLNDLSLTGGWCEVAVADQPDPLPDALAKRDVDAIVLDFFNIVIDYAKSSDDEKIKNGDGLLNFARLMKETYLFEQKRKQRESFSEINKTDIEELLELIRDADKTLVNNSECMEGCYAVFNSVFTYAKKLEQKCLLSGLGSLDKLQYFLDSGSVWDSEGQKCSITLNSEQRNEVYALIAKLRLEKASK